SLLLKDGRKLDGKYAEIGSIAENPLSPKTQAGEVPLTPLLVIDDGLRRTFIHSAQVAKVLEPAPAKDVRTNIHHPVAEPAHALRQCRAPHLSDASGGRPGGGCSRHHTNHAPLHESRGPQRTAEIDRLGHADRDEQYPSRHAEPCAFYRYQVQRLGGPAAS